MAPVVLAALVVGIVALAAAAPLWGLGVVVGVVAMTPSLAWQLGLPNLALPWVAGWALCAGFGIRLLVQTRSADRPRMADTDRALWGVFLLLAASGVVGLVRGAQIGLPSPGDLASLVLLRAPDRAGEFQAAATPLLGLTVAGFASALMGRVYARRFVARALYAGCALAAFGPVLQTLFLDPNVRPDWGLRVTDGIVGFFQDPHSLATVLAVAVGLAVYRWLDGQGRWLSIGLFVVSVAGLFATRSRAGFVAAIVALVVAVVITRSDASDRLPLRAMRCLAGAWVLGVVMVLVVAMELPGARGVVLQLESLEHMNVSRWFAMRGDIPAEVPTIVMRQRSWLWRKAGLVMKTDPLWGLGPGRFARAVVIVEDEGEPVAAPFLAENAHNYPLQLAAEFGWLPALGWLLLMMRIWYVAVRGCLQRPRFADTRSLGVAAVGLTPLLVTSLIAHPFLLAEIQLVSGALMALAITGSGDRGEGLR